MMKLALGIEYIGTYFHGWQKQKNGIRTVQSVVEKALAKVANHSVRVFCAGRTDSGVHAQEQVIHFTCRYPRPNSAWLIGANCYLPKDVSIKWVRVVDANFHARFSAIAREYHYRIYNNPIRSASKEIYSLWQPRNLSLETIQQGAKYLIGTHDFSAFRSSACSAKFATKKIMHLRVEHDCKFLLFNIKADAFLHHMVRNIIGTLLRVGHGLENAAWVKKVLASKNRNIAGATAPAHGLHFVKAYYASW